MDPNEALARIRMALDRYSVACTELEVAERKYGSTNIPEADADKFVETSADVLDQLVEHVTALDTWLSAGGFTPHAWHHVPRPNFTWMSVEFVRHVRRLTPGLDRNGTDVSGEPEILQIAEGEMGLVIEDEQGRQVVLDGTPQAVQRLVAHLSNLARRGVEVIEPAWRIEPLGPPDPAHGELPEHHDA